MPDLDAWLYPQLRGFAPADRAAALRKARETPFDAIELVGIAIGLVAVTALTRYGAMGWSLPDRAAAFAANLAVAAALLVVLIAPFFVRRVRRGLDQQIERKTRR